MVNTYMVEEFDDEGSDDEEGEGDMEEDYESDDW